MTYFFVILVSLTLPAQSFGFECFKTGDNILLRDAVQQYIADSSNTSAVATKYGHPIGSWCVKDLDDFSKVFQNCDTFDEPLSNWDTSSSTSMAYMFEYASSFNQKLDHFVVSSVVDFQGMFSHAYSFDQDISNWNLQSAKYLANMFLGSSVRFTAFRKDLCAWGSFAHNFIDVTDMFVNTDCADVSDPNLDASPPGPFCLPCTDDEEPAQASTSTTTACLKNGACLAKVRKQCTCSDLESEDSTENNSTCVADAVEAECCSANVTSKRKQQYAEKVRRRFKNRYCTEFEPVCFQTKKELRAAVEAYMADPSSSSTVATTYGYPIGNWCVKNVTDFSKIFDGLDTFNEPLTNWDTSSATKMARMFRHAAAFNQDVSHFKTGLVTDFTEMFHAAQSFDQELFMWNMSSAKNLTRMFSGRGDNFNSTVVHMNFRRDLCEWNVYAANFENVSDMFAETDCPVETDPDLAAVPPGPFCFRCNKEQAHCVRARECLQYVRTTCPTCDHANGNDNSTCVNDAVVSHRCCTEGDPPTEYLQRIQMRFKRRYCS